MKRKAVHIIISFFFLIVFQMPVWIQLEHTVHKHTAEPQTCEGHDVENHIHINKDDSCFLLHRPVNSVLQVLLIDYQEITNNIKIEISNELVVSALKQLIRYANLRAPPKSN